MTKISSNQGTIPGLAPGVELVELLSPYIRHCGDARRPAWKLDTRRLLDFLLVYIAEGTGLFEIAGTPYTAEPGDLFWIPPDTPHRMEGFPPSMVCPYAHFDLQYRPQISHWDFSIPAGMLDLSELKPLMHPPVRHPEIRRLCGRIRTFTNRRVGELLQEICAEAARAQPYGNLRMSGMMLEIIGEILRGLRGLSADYSEHIALLEEAARYMHEHCEEDIGIGELADMCRLSRSYFRRIFGRHFGCSPRSYLRRARIHTAKQLMIGSDMNLTEIAMRVGFATLHSFSRAFRSVEGINPSQYRSSGTPLTRVEGRNAQYAGVPGRAVHGR